MIEAFGAIITLTPGEQGTDGAILKVKDLVDNNPEKRKGFAKAMWCGCGVSSIGNGRI